MHTSLRIENMEEKKFKYTNTDAKLYVLIYLGFWMRRPIKTFSDPTNTDTHTHTDRPKRENDLMPYHIFRNTIALRPIPMQS